MEWLETNFIVGAAIFVGLVAFFAQEGRGVLRTLSGTRVGAMRVPMTSFVGHKPRVAITVRRGSGIPHTEGGVRVIVGSHFTPIDVLKLNGAQASNLADCIDRAAAECE